MQFYSRDISELKFELNKSFELINAIGELFHIVNDEKWLSALKDLSNHLTEDGFMVVGGDFGL